MTRVLTLVADLLQTSLFNQPPAKRQRLHLLYPVGATQGAKYQNSLLATRSEYTILATEFVRACQMGGMVSLEKAWTDIPYFL
jgi:hypothetical protein